MSVESGIHSQERFRDRGAHVERGVEAREVLEGDVAEAVQESDEGGLGGGLGEDAEVGCA